ncbi:MAG: DUF1016 domain-containing protein [Methanomicrobia archaeon]|nr:DUF1016 domain-containing protein [Methanomicrobia archaeon]
MSGSIIKTEDYKAFIRDIKRRIQTVQIKAAVAVNQELLCLYWDLAGRIVTKQKQTAWGDGFIVQMSRDLQEEFPGMKGFSERNLKYIRQWYLFYSCHEIGQQLVAQLTQIPWGHNIAIICKSKNDTVVEYALKDVHKPIGVSEYIITRNLPDELKSSLPSIEEIEAELRGGDE